MILPNSEQMRQIDKCAINEFMIPGIVLMENAGAGTVQLMEQLLGPQANRLFPIFIGPGNNGGDGLVIARHLHQRNAVVLLIFLIKPERLKGDSAINLKIVAIAESYIHFLDQHPSSWAWEIELRPWVERF